MIGGINHDRGHRAASVGLGLSGTTLGSYRLLRPIGRGRSAEVYLAEHVEDRTRVAVKVLLLHLAGEEQQAFLDEMQVLAALRHPHLVRTHDYGLAGDVPYIVMSYVPHGTIVRVLPGGEPLAPEKILPYIEQIADALHYAHEHHVQHLDLQPGNLLLGGNYEVLLSDTAIARLMQDVRSPGALNITGNILYLAPEQLKGKGSPASDQYALGIITYEWLCGHCPFEGTFSSVSKRHLHSPVPSLSVSVPTLPVGIEQVVLRALAKDPARRFESIKAFAHAFEEACRPQTFPPFPLSNVLTQMASKSQLSLPAPVSAHNSENALPVEAEEARPEPVPPAETGGDEPKSALPVEAEAASPEPAVETESGEQQPEASSPAVSDAPLADLPPVSDDALPVQDEAAPADSEVDAPAPPLSTAIAPEAVEATPGTRPPSPEADPDGRAQGVAPTITSTSEGERAQGTTPATSSTSTGQQASEPAAQPAAGSEPAKVRQTLPRPRKSIVPVRPRQSAPAARQALQPAPVQPSFIPDGSCMPLPPSRPAPLSLPAPPLSQERQMMGEAPATPATMSPLQPPPLPVAPPAPFAPYTAAPGPIEPARVESTWMPVPGTTASRPAGWKTSTIVQRSLKLLAVRPGGARSLTRPVTSQMLRPTTAYINTRLPPRPDMYVQSFSRRTFIAGVAGLVGLAAIGGGTAWYLLQPHSVTLGTTLYTYVRHGNQVLAAAWSPAVSTAASTIPRIASGSLDHTVQVWDALTGDHGYTYNGHTDAVEVVAWSPDGRAIASGGVDRQVHVWNAATGHRLLAYTGHSDSVLSLSWSPNGKYIASAGKDATVQVWDAQKGHLLFTYRGHADWIGSVAWSPNGKYIASASADKTVQVWNAQNGRRILTYKGHMDKVWAVAWASDSQRIASGGDDHTVQVWQASTGYSIYTYRGHNNPVETVAWAPDGQRIASGGEDKTVQVWHPSSDENAFTYSNHYGTVWSVAWSPDGQRIASGSLDHTVQVWQAV